MLTAGYSAVLGMEKQVVLNAGCSAVGVMEKQVL